MKTPPIAFKGFILFCWWLLLVSQWRRGFRRAHQRRYRDILTSYHPIWLYKASCSQHLNISTVFGNLGCIVGSSVLLVCPQSSSLPWFHFHARFMVPNNSYPRSPSDRPILEAKKQGKNRANIFRRCFCMFGQFLWWVYGKDMAKSSVKLFCSILNL